MSPRGSTYILGVNAYHGDVSAVLVKDGNLIAAVEEERFRRIKHWAGFPTQSIQKCLEMAEIRGDDVSHVAVSRDPRAHLFRKARYVLTQRPGIQLIGDRLRNARELQDLREPLATALRIPAGALPRIHYVEHHPAHLASAFFVSPFETAAVCAIDGFGDFVSTSTAIGSGRELEVLDRVYFPHSLGMLYTAVTQYLGFLNFGDEYKVMGLAPYGRPEFVSELRNLVRLTNGGKFQLDLRYFRHTRGVEATWKNGPPDLGIIFTHAMEDLLGSAREPGDPLTSRHQNIAHSLQAVYEECVFHILNALWEKAHITQLCLAGGCAMNSVANGKIRANTPFEELYIQPAAGDNGTALGAAYWVWHKLLEGERSFRMDHAYWGPAYDTQPPWVEDGSRFDRVEFDSERETCRATAELLAEGNVLGWFQGRMEWGARALGNRSILADPRRPQIREIINTKIKFREKFRPFAPAILEEALHDYFVDAVPDPFMQQVYPVRTDKHDVIPAVTHVDGTGRMQTVTEESNPTFYRLIGEFGRLTGVPVLLNTSFNENEPIVNTPEEALDCFLRTRMDGLVIGNSLIRRLPVDAAQIEAHKDVDSGRA